MEPVWVREVRGGDWSAILELANRSVAHVPGAGPQDEWLRNRKQHDLARGPQRQFVAEGPSGIVGYGAIESGAAHNPRAFRLFVVTAPEQLATLGERLYQEALTHLTQLRASEAWFTEYAADAALVDFARCRGFSESRRFRLPSGVECVVLFKDLASRTA